MKKVWLIIFISLFIWPVVSVAQTNAGFVSGVWYSKTPFFAGETIRIYSAVQNQSGYDITGTIKFFDDGKIIGESDFSAINGRLVEKWIDWKVTEGEHKIQTKIFDAKKSLPGGGEEAISLITGSSDISEVFADLDTDGDGVGNKDDNDDDGDGIADSIEIKSGTNPLIANSSDENNNKIAKSDISDTSNESKVDEGKQMAEKFVVDPAKKAIDAVSSESKPVIERIGELLVEKHDVVQAQIVLDRKEKENSNLDAVATSGFYEKIQEKLPPMFRIMYGWLLKVLIFIFSIWWIPLTIGILIVLRILLSVYRRMRYK
jgi:hypothetical protein